MKRVFSTHILPLILLCWVVLQANAQVTIAYCKLGGGCQFYQTAYSYAEIDGMFNYLGTFEKDKGILVFFRNKQQQDIHYPDRKRGPRELNEYFGGKCEPAIAKGGMAPFPEAIQPKNGNWSVITAEPVTKNCPAQLTAQLKSVSGLKSGQKVFKKPFSPDDLLPEKTPWLSIAPNGYKAFLMTRTAPTFTNTYDFEVVSPVRITGSLLTQIRIPNQATCEVRTNFSYQHTP
ncbi:hypothetical protein F5984_23375 [Rudanella paleaurantiibacter]|uniref:Uncharacterized protein n=1 Tax=Rudanella paleaurantiibacter TaxID=2614655 RepID=A0A7J5TVC0_9BACT|nr:hypothetical protein [Rudanella paleaurantiibacter]KAB7726858.1 hypothetical protein F5984_23375 [Rudanella paleaurantiibacter]